MSHEDITEIERQQNTMLNRTENDDEMRECADNMRENFEITDINGVHKYKFGEISIKPVIKKSEGDVWKHFGHIYKENKIIPMLSKKIACKNCFEKRIWKW